MRYDTRLETTFCNTTKQQQQLRLHYVDSKGLNVTLRTHALKTTMSLNTTWSDMIATLQKQP